MLSIIIPNRTEPNIVKLIDDIEKMGIANQIIISTDRESKGKGWAIREALKQAEGNYIIFIDGDYDIHPSQITKLLEFLPKYNVVVGRKRIVYLPLKRKIITILSRIYIKLLFGITVDTQTGIKAFDYKPEFALDGYSFSMEILNNAKKLGKTMIEVPIEATVTDSKGVKVLWHTFKDSLRVKFQL